LFERETIDRSRREEYTPTVASPGTMLGFSPEASPILQADEDTRVVLIGGEPLDGQRYIWWNFVSSSAERIEEAARRWRDGQFPKIPHDEVEFVPLPGEPHLARDEQLRAPERVDRIDRRTIRSTLV
jgi:hypothetical protein